jgi:hypothetical protein
MSYEKVRSIKIDEEQGKVFINCASNNVRPLHYTRENYPYFTKILKEKGRKEVEIELLKAYESGSLQGGNNKYTYALKVLRYVYGQEYAKFNWRNHNATYGTEEYKKERELRDSQEFRDLLWKALQFKKTNHKWVICKDHWGTEVCGKLNPTCMSWKNSLKGVTKFDFEKEAEDNIFSNFKDVWYVKQIA